MKKTDFSPARQQQLVHATSHPGAFAIIPSAPPRFIPSKGIIKEVIHAHEALGELRVSTARLSNPNLVTRDHLFDITREKRTVERRGLLAALQSSAIRNGMNLWSCAEAEKLDDVGIKHGHCIDGQLIGELFGGAGKLAKDNNQRKECGCVESVDMGIYNTCSFQCAYCYANASLKMIAANLNKHSSSSPGIIGEYQKGSLPADNGKPSAKLC